MIEITGSQEDKTSTIKTGRFRAGPASCSTHTTRKSSVRTPKLVQFLPKYYDSGTELDIYTRSSSTSIVLTNKRKTWELATNTQFKFKNATKHDKEKPQSTTKNTKLAGKYSTTTSVIRNDKVDKRTTNNYKRSAATLDLEELCNNKLVVDKQKFKDWYLNKYSKSNISCNQQITAIKNTGSTSNYYSILEEKSIANQSSE
jgi:hypothetical protein